MSDDPMTERRYPSLRDRRIRSTGPGPGAGHERDPWHASMLQARTAIVATIVLGQLWGLTVALNAWLAGRVGQVWLLLGFEALSFAVAVIVWRASTRDR